MSASVTHFEIYAEDLPGLAQFYRDLFDWKIEKAPGVDYFRIQTGSAEDHGIAGGMLNRPIPGPRSWVHYVLVDSIDQTIERVQSLGGKLVRAKQPCPRRPGTRSWKIPKATSLPSISTTRWRCRYPSRRIEPFEKDCE